MGYLYIFCTIFFTVYGQLTIKWQVSKVGAMPEALTGKMVYLGHLFLNPWVLTAFFSAFLASLFWMAALTKFELSYAYPFMSFSFVSVLILGVLLFNESISISKVLSMVLIIAGIIVGSRG